MVFQTMQNAYQHVSAFKLNCSTEFGSLELNVCLHDVNDKTDIQQLLALKYFEINILYN